MRLLAALVLASAVLALAAYTYLTLLQAQGTHTGATSITVAGTGEVVAKPDIATFTFAVETNGDDATTAQNQGADVLDAITSYLTEQGVDAADVKTQYYNLTPKYRYEERVCATNTYCPPGDRVQDGYMVTQGVEVKVRESDTAGALIGGVGDRGATNISSLSFTIDDESALQEAARAKAIEDAKAQAVMLADSLGMRLGDLIGFSEGGSVPYYGGAVMEAAYAMDSMESRSAVVPAGENTITSNVTLTYELK